MFAVGNAKLEGLTQDLHMSMSVQSVYVKRG